MAKQFYLRFFLIFLGFGSLSACATETVAQTSQSGISEQALKGATPQILTADFGPPLLRRTDGPAQVWLYQNATCNLDVFLYQDSFGTPRVSAVLPDNGVNLHNCLLGLAQPTTAAALERSAAS